MSKTADLYRHHHYPFNDSVLAAIDKLEAEAAGLREALTMAQHFLYDDSGKAIDGELWSFIRSVMSQGASIQQDYMAGKYPSYEYYAARIDAAASERANELEARLARSTDGGTSRE